MVSDALFNAGFDRFLQQRLHQSKGASNTYVYVFNYRGQSGFTDILVNADVETDWGVSHAEDFMYMFPVIKSLVPHRVMSNEDMAFGREYVRLLTDFAAVG